MGERKKTDIKYICQIGPGMTLPGGMLTVIQTYLKSDYLSEYDQKHIVTASKNRKLRTFIVGLIKYFLLCINRKVLVAHIHMSERGSCSRAILFILISKIFKIPVVVHSHGSEIEEFYENLSSWRKKIFSFSMRKANRIIILTQGWRFFWEKIVAKEKIVVIPNSVVIPVKTRKQYCRHNRLNLLFLGYVGDRKGTYDLVRAMKKVDDQKLDWRLIIGGNGEIEKCKQLVTDLGLQNKITVYGWMNSKEKEAALVEADVLVLPSHFESFGIVILEAFAHQLSVICSDGGFSPEIVDENVNGYVSKVGDYIDLASKISKIDEKDKLLEFGNNAYEKVRLNYSEKNVVLSLKNVYRELEKKYA